MVFESVVVDVLNRFLGDYVVNLDSSQLQLGIWGGAVALKNLEIKENALYQFDVPFKVKAGHIGHLNLQIPWKNLYTQPVEAVLDEVYLLIVPTASIKYDAEKEEKQHLEAKQKELQRIEDAKQKIADKDKAQEKPDTFIEKLITQVIRNLQLKISNIHIRYEDDITNKDIPLSFGISLENLSLQTSDQDWNPCMQDATTKLFYKLVRLDNFFAYWNVKSEMYYHGDYKESLSHLKYGIASTNVIPEGYSFVFRPISAKAKLRMNPRSDVDFSAPKLDLDVNLQDITIELNKPQYFSIMELLESIDMMTRNLPYRKYRPEVPVHNNARKWWRYVTQGILEVNIQPKLQMWSWEHIRYHRNQVKSYKELYKIKITSKKATQESLFMLEDLEKTLDIFNITLARQQAEFEAIKAGLKIFKPGAKQDDEDSGGWFSWMWGWAGGKSGETKQEPKGIEQLMTSQEKDKLYAAIGYSETAVDPTLPKTYEAVKLYVKLISMSVLIRENKEKPELIKLALIDLRTTVAQRPGAEAIRFESSVSAFEVQGMAQKKTVPCLLSSHTVHSQHNASLFTIMFETNPLDENCNQRLIIESQPLEIIYDAMTVNSLLDFFRPPSDVHLEQITSATLTKLEEFRDKTATGLVYIIETQKVLDLKINLMSSYVIVPQNGFYEATSNKLLLDLGHLKMSSKCRSTLSDIKVGESALEDIMSRAYDRFDIQLSSIQLLYSRHYENWEGARRLQSSSQHILQPLDVKMELNRAMVVTDARMPKYKMYGELPLLSFNISDEKLKSILELIDSIPKPKNSSDSTAVLQPSKLQASSLITTPQMSTSVLPFLEAISIAGSSESEDEFYDAPSSPLEDLPFFEAPLGSLSRASSFRKNTTKTEPLKNMTDFQLRFEISEVFVQVCRLAEDIEKPILRLEILKLGTELKLRTYDMTATAFLREICLMCPEYIDNKDQPVYIISTLDNSVEDLLSIEYIKADINAPELKHTYQNVLQLIKVTFSSIDIHLHTEALLSTMNFLNNLLPPQEATTVEIVQEKEGKKEVLKKFSSKKSKHEDVCDLHLLVDMNCLRIFIREQKRWISEISIEGLDSQVIMKKETTEISAKLKNIIILDCDVTALYKKALYITGKEVFSLKMITYTCATDGASFTNMNAVDSKIYLTVGCIQIIFVNKFVSAILAFINNFQMAKEAITEATVQAAEKAATGVKELAKQSSRMALDINIKAPVVIIPQSAVSTDVLVADFGMITIKNEFMLVKTKLRYSVPPVLDSICVKLSELKLFRSNIMSGLLQNELQLLQPLNLEVKVERNLAALWYHEIPDINIFGRLKPINLILSEADITTMLRTLNENLGDSSESPSVQEKKDVLSIHSGAASVSQHSGAGATVVTSAVVEMHSLVKVKTTLKLDFQFDSLTLVLYSPHSKQPHVKDERDNSLKLAEFKLLLIAAAVKMLSDGSLNASVKLTNCTLDDKRETLQKATPRMVEMKHGSEKKVMVNISYKQGRDGTTVVDTIVEETYLCASVEFLLAVAEVFLNANAESTAANKNFRQTLSTKEQAPVQSASTMEINLTVKNPDIVFVADLTRKDASALVATAQCEISIKSAPGMYKMTAVVEDVNVKACPFFPALRKGNITTVLQPCDLFFNMMQSGEEPQKAELSIKSLTIKVSPIIINTVITITSALFPTKETSEKDLSPVPPDLWDKKNIKNLNMWFLEESIENKDPVSVAELIPTGESLTMKIETVVITLEAGVGHKTVPMLSAKSSFSGEVKNWSSLINLSSRLELEVHYFNEMFGVWEPLLEPLEVEGSDEFRPWVLELKMKKKNKKAFVESVAEEEHYKVPEYKTVITIYSQNQLNITLSKCGLLMLTNLGTAFAEAATESSEIFKKDRAPFVLINSLGVSVTVLPSESFSVLNIEPTANLFHLEDGQSLNMEYIRTKSEQDQFTAMTTLSSKVFYIWLTPQNHSTTDEIPLTKVGRSLYRVRHNDSGVVRSIVCQIDTVDGSRIVTVHSPIQIKNHFSIPLSIFEDGKCLGVALPDNEFNIPLTSYRSLLFFRPVIDENETSGEYESSEGVSFDEMVKNFDKLLQKKCRSLKSPNHPLIINIVPMQDTLITSTCTDDQWDLPYVVHLWSSVILRNLLPYQIAYSLEGYSTTRSALEAGCSAQIHNALLDQSKLELHLLNYLDKDWTTEYCIQSNQQEISFITFSCISDLDRTDLDIAIHVTYATGQVIIAIHSPYWMVNKTGRMLQYKADGIHRKHPPDYKLPLLFSFQPKHFYHDNKVQLMVTDSELSDHFSLDTVGSHGFVKCKSHKKEYQVGVTIHNSSFNITRIVTFTPFLMVTNRSTHILEVAEEGSENWIPILFQQCIPFWPENNDSKLQVRVKDSYIPPNVIQLDKQENCLLLHLDNKLGGITVDITLAEHSTTITFSNYHDGAAPFLIINHTKEEVIEYGQSSLTSMEETLEPNKAVLYTWADPVGSRKLRWKCGKKIEEITQKDDLIKPFEVGAKHIFIVSFFEGLQRIILFTEDEKVFKMTYESEKVELAEQEIIVSLQDVGISLVNNYLRQEIAYIGITSSDVIWETKPKKKSRWKPLSVKQTDKLEKEFIEYCDNSPTENKVVELDDNIPVCLTPTGNDMKILQPYEFPVRRSFLPALKVQYSTSEHQSSFRVQIYRIQIQNQIPGAIFPFVFYPIKPPKSISLNSEPKPFTDVSIVMRTAGHSRISRIKYFKVLIQEMDLRLDLGFLYALSDFFTLVDELPKDQEVELFKKDVESAQEELKNAVSTDTSQISLYEYFHISPIKLHLSFSLSTGGEESNKDEKHKDLIPVQSLNLLLKSIGATLTDVQDVVLKLAFFELNYHFCTTQQLQWAVIMHYSKQAIKQMYVLVLGLDVLGNPFGFIRDLSEGVEAFFYEPYQGAIQGPEEFVEGMALGLKALVGGAVGGLAGAASRITGAMAKGVAAITMDEDYQQKRREAMNKQPAGLKEGFTRGGKGLVSGFVSGITGIVTKPIRGAQKEGAAGFFKGVGKGLVGAVARPTGGIIDMASSTFQGIKRATNASEDVLSLRPPRFFGDDGVIRPYRLRDGAGSQMLQNIENGRFAKLRYFTHAMVNNTDLLMVTKSGILFVTRGTFGQLTCEWQYTYDEFTKKPFIVDGRRLRIEAKERVKSVFHAKEFGKIINFRTPEDAKWILSKLEEKVKESQPKL
ncbi:intermembrane lipid transfer protein VPS13A [Ahaetulla prasina]|uniref:intermembrane lipid transfer protein VPS13A n=1 Tax=Ahaetulla prasina TaxID=499056 RepID=UPI00264819F1|nr:intermembrane lipid transfer protein VPS13A [Ahaetulla prasina]